RAGHRLAEGASRPQLCSELELGTLTIAAGGSSDLARAFTAVLAACDVSGPVHVEARTELPAGAGLGCSAALGVAIVRAFDALSGRVPRTPTEVAHCAAAWERVFHGNPSGVDAAAVSRGGCFFYQRHAASEQRLEPTFSPQNPGAEDPVS